MTKKQFTALVFSICVTVLAVIYFAVAVGVGVAELKTNVDSDEVADKHGPVGIMALLAYSIMVGFVMVICFVGALLHSLVGLFTACASVRAESKGAKITSIVLISLNGVLIAGTVLPLLISIFK